MNNLQQLKDFKTFLKSNDPELSDDVLFEKIDKYILKIITEAYDKGYQAGANQMNNDPCLCGFWGKKK